MIAGSALLDVCQLPNLDSCSGCDFSRNTSAVDFLSVRDTFVTVLLKIVQLVMACAIFNPFCCCTAGVLSVDDVDLVPAAHSCCKSQSSELPADGGSNKEHDITECPHAALKDYEATIHKDLSATNDNSTLLPALFVVCDLLMIESTTQALLPVRETTLSQAPPRSFAQVYCVYRV
jgi:hypothetical protein